MKKVLSVHYSEITSFVKEFQFLNDSVNSENRTRLKIILYIKTSNKHQIKHRIKYYICLLDNKLFMCLLARTIIYWTP